MAALEPGELQHGPGGLQPGIVQPGIFQPYLGRSISIWRLWEVYTDTHELHVQFFVHGTLADILPVYVYRRSTPANQFGSETDPHGVTRAVPGDRLSPSLRKPANHDPQQGPYTLPDMIVQWLWEGVSLVEMTLRYVQKYARGDAACTIHDNAATWGEFSVKVTETVLFECTHDGEQSPLIYDCHVRQWILPDCPPPRAGQALREPRVVPRQAAQWLRSEALRLGARRFARDPARVLMLPV
jgi:hypothetical protein